MKSRVRDPYIDILKGIGIVSVVIGHAGILFPWMKNTLATEFLYLYHLMIFFFAAGMTYNPEKYRDPYDYIGRQLKAAAPLYIGYNLAFVLSHNIFTSIHLQDAARYSAGEMLTHISSVLVMMHTEPLTGALWFVPMFLLAKAFFGIAFQWAERQRHRFIAHALIVLVTAVIGLYASTRQMFWLYHLQTAVLGIPIIYLGYVFTQWRQRLTGLLRPIMCVLCALTMYLCVRYVGFVELSQNRIISPALFYPVTVVGVTFCLALAQILQCWKRVATLFSYLGRTSFHIMALHFLAFKIIDWVCGLLIGLEWDQIARFPVSLDKMGWLYSIVGIGLPAVAVHIVQRPKTHKQEVRG